jgi:hypothetical protein
MLTTIDKVKLSSTNYSLDDVNMLGINCHNKQPNKELSMMPCGIDAKGNELIGINAFIHSIDIPYHLNLQQDYFGQYRAWVEFNPNKFNSLEDAVNKIDHHLKETNQFEFNFTGSILSRMDIACDDDMNENAKEYHLVIQSIMKHRYGKNEKEFPHSLTYLNTKWEKCTYDRGLKNYLELNGEKTGSPTKFMRDELRLKSPAYIKDHFGIITLDDALELNESNLKTLFVNTSKKFIRKQQEIAKRNPDEHLDSIIKLVNELLKLPSRKERILTYLNTSNKETNHIKSRKLFSDAIVEIANQKEWTSRQNKSNFIARELNQFDLTSREQNQIRQERVQRNEETITHKLDEYHSKFLVA